MKQYQYIDTSAYLCVLLGEPGASAMATRFAAAELCSSVLLMLEARRTVAHLARTGRLTAAQVAPLLEKLHIDAAKMSLRDLTLDLAFDHAMPVLRTPRSLDLVHLRTALWFHRREPLHGYLTNDALQREAARELGLPVP